MIQVENIALSKNTVSKSEQFIIQVGLTEVFPTWANLKKVTWKELSDYTWKQAETLIIKE